MIGHGDGFAPSGGDWSWITGFAIVVAVVVGLILLVGWIADRAGWSDERPAWDDPDLGPLDVLRMRYAYGEISHDEYVAAKVTLESSVQTTDPASQT